MPDEVLTNLCSVCHAEPHKYKCPGCGARTCSLPCIKKHKLRTECSGRHNPTDYVPIEKLRTPAGIDHDYNFISAIDRAKQRAERDIVEELQLLRKEELHPQDENRAFHKVWRGDQLHHFIDRRYRGAKPIDNFDKHVRRRLKALDIDARGMPKGMARQKENATTFNRRTGCINWQVEWFVYGVSGLFDQQQEQQSDKPIRILHRVLDNKPLHQGLATSLEWHRGQLDYISRNQQPQQKQQHSTQEDGIDLPEQEKKNKTRPPSWKRKKDAPTTKEYHFNQTTQDPETGAWPSNNLLLQYSQTSQWNQWAPNCSASIPPTDAEKAERFASPAAWRYFLHQTNKPVPGGKKALIPIGSRDTLAQVLSGRSVVEFPTIYVFPSSFIGEGLPEGFVRGSTERWGRDGKRKIEECDSDSSSSGSESDSDSDSDSSSSSSDGSGESEGHVAKKRKREEDVDEGEVRDGNSRNGFNSRGGRQQDRGRGRGRGRGGRDRGGLRGRGRGQQQNPRGRIHGRPGSREGAEANHNNSNYVPVSQKRGADHTEDEGEIMSDGGAPPEMMDIVREGPYNGGGQDMHTVMGMGNDVNMGEADKLQRDGRPVEAQQPKGGMGLVDYGSDESD